MKNYFFISWHGGDNGLQGSSHAGARGDDPAQAYINRISSRSIDLRRLLELREDKPKFITG